MNDALEQQYLRERRRARSAMLVGGGAAGVGLLLTLFTVFATDAGGGVYVVFTGAIAGGLVELFHGLSLQPGPPPYLDE